MSTAELLQVFAAAVPHQALHNNLDSDRSMTIDWSAGGARSAARPLQWVGEGEKLPELACAPHSMWSTGKTAAWPDYSVDWWRMTLPTGLFFRGSREVTLTQTLGRSYYYSRYMGYLRTAQIIAVSIQKYFSAAPPRFVIDLADLACGSGWLGTILASILPALLRVHFADISSSAVVETQLNVEANGVNDSASYYVGDLFAAYGSVSPHPQLAFDHIVFYPPQSDANLGARNDCLRGGVCVMPDDSYFAPTEIHFFERFSQTFRDWLKPSGGSVWLAVDDHLVQDVLSIFQRLESTAQLRAIKFAAVPAVLIEVTIRPARREKTVDHTGG